MENLYYPPLYLMYSQTMFPQFDSCTLQHREIVTSLNMHATNLKIYGKRVWYKNNNSNYLKIYLFEKVDAPRPTKTPTSIAAMFWCCRN
jgi:hypothetical protein